MKKLFLILTALCFFTYSFAAFEIKTVAKNANQIFLPIGKNQQISLMDLSTITVKNFEKLTGKDLNFIDRLSFKIWQKKIKKGINADGTIADTKFMKYMSDGDHSTGFHIGGFALGFFLPLIGVLIAYLIGGDEDVRKNRVKWAWIGTGFMVVILSAILKALISA